MTFELGIVCGRCDTYSAMGTARCPTCSGVLALFPGEGAAGSRTASRPDPGESVVPTSVVEPQQPGLYDDALRPRRKSSGRLRAAQPKGTAPQEPAAAAPPPTVSKRPLSTEELMEQARNFVCRSCS